ncbi:hypothetical protein I7I51_05692 [Histoplasma capsulatum]|uniref:Letm1 RBD domain-containing protein n=1 Tax=Ajellomyces capsulatus TaxID=5037 RepID=A0A8A1M9N2_AJECA|nr:hypothetical protein I7I51_05692 [Histoplasma capsulatum]
MLANSTRGLCATVSVLPAGFRSPHVPHPTHVRDRQRIQDRYLLPFLINNGAGSAHFSSTPGPLKPPPTTSDSTSATTATTLPTVTKTSPLNASTSTLPAPLSLPPKDPTANKAKYYFTLGKAYLSFYKTGLKNLIRRAAYDVRRIIPFSLILMLCGEMTPFVVLALGSLVTPFTCRVPRQVEKERVKACLRKERAVRAAEVDGAAAAAADGVSGGELSLKANAIANLDVLLNATAIPPSVDINGLINHASTAGVLRACAVFGLSRGHELAGGSLLPGFVVAEVVNQVYRPRLRRWMRYLEVDDWLIVKNGGVDGMNADEIRIAVHERGGVDVSVGLKDGEAEVVERRWLENWILETPPQSSLQIHRFLAICRSVMQGYGREESTSFLIPDYVL